MSGLQEQARRPSAIYSIDEFRQRAERESGPFETTDWGDHRWNLNIADHFFRRRKREAAVLIGVVERASGAHVLLTRRTDHLKTHSGQVAFPGGRIDPGDDGPVGAALREAQEEVALPIERAEVIGRLPDYATGSGFKIVPVLALLHPPFDLRPEPGEVADIFEVPLSFLMEQANHIQDSRIWEGQRRYYWTMPFDDWHIWGVTAGIIRMMQERLYP
ncbi:CoA pyrophosphatase [Notoacmeibacter marinus]|uniref:CoA pyrophosphatase n=1 Tax=Notoacmeibacter marinus TaxID=1876515 RepID=UPI000DF27B73|nr:CoA pyrophosphatase [Notoacmeibacter marinus]